MKKSRARKTVKKMKTKCLETAMLGTLPEDHYSTFNLMRTFVFAAGMYKHEAQEMLKNPKATVLELTLCKALLNEYKKNNDTSAIRWQFMKCAHRISGIGIVKNNK